jgi:threonyl-tRNA synthetase
MPEENYEDSQLYRIRHSLAHIMAQAMLERFPEAKIAIGPPIEDGLYYDFDLPRPITDEDVKWVEKRMRKISSQVHEFTMREVSPDEAREISSRTSPTSWNSSTTCEGVASMKTGTKSHRPSRDKLDLHAGFVHRPVPGPHVESTKEIDPKSFSISYKPVAGAYWRGNSDNAQLTRIYGTAWEKPEELKDYLRLLDEAKKRDHRVVGEKLKLFTINPLVGKG